MNRKITLISALLFLGLCFTAKGQYVPTSCPPNVDFELGTYADWTYYRGSVNTGPIFSLTTTAPVPTLHQLENATSGFDAYGGFPLLDPTGGNYAMKIGKDSTLQAAMRCQYQLHIPAGAGVYSLIYHYAVVLEDPIGHTANEQPRFIVEAIDSTTGHAIPCDSFDYVGDGTTPGFVPLGGASDVLYLPWTMGNFKFPGENGKTVTLQVTSGDCTLSGHWGYGYIDFTCGLFDDVVINCASGTTYLTGPDGFEGYDWKDSTTFSIDYGSSQTVAVVSPTVTTTYAVILTPYAGFGCTDTLYTKVNPSLLAFHPTDDTSLCAGTSLTLTSGATSPYTPITYVWGPAVSLSCTTCASPVATPSISTVYWVTATDGQGCSKTDSIHVTLYSVPTSITGPTNICIGASASLGSSPPGGVWTSSATGIASIGASSGVVTGVSTGTTALISYTLGVSCRTTRGITVNPLPGVITGTLAVCVGHTTTLSDTSAGGVWSSEYTGIGTIGSGTGLVTGISAGITIDTFTKLSTGCHATVPVTVNPAPGTPFILGPPGLCVGATIYADDLTPGGSWSCSPLTTGSITAGGLVTGIATGTLTITYTLPTGCYATTNLAVNPLPLPISGPNHLCIGDTITLTDPTPGGAWASPSLTSILYVPSPSSGLMWSSAGSGVDTVTYTNSGGCSATYYVTVNPFPSPISGLPSVCIGASTGLTDADPGTWSGTPSSVATVGTSTGVVSGISYGTETITYTGTTGCKTTSTIMVDSLPAPITGPTTLCVGTSITLSDITLPGTWTTGSGGIIVGGGTGTVTGFAVGTDLVTFTNSGCSRTYTVTVNTTPPAITTFPPGGPMTVCQGGTLVLEDGIAGGLWSPVPASGVVTVAAITTATVTGVVTGSLSAATATITYSLGAGCSTSAVVTVEPLPGAITPTSPVVCAGSSITLADPTSPGGTWSTPGPYGSIVSISGVLTGISSGVEPVTYTAPSGCFRTTNITVNPVPLGITGPTPMAVCLGSTITLHDGTGGGTWSSLSPSATITSIPGVLTGVGLGTATIKYTLPTTCSTTTLVTVNPLPGIYAIGGGGAYCAGATPPGKTITLSGSQVGVNYQIYIGGAPSGIILPGTGLPLNFGLQATGGIYTIVATYPGTGCSSTMTGSETITVNPVPTIIGPTALCVGTTITETGSITGGTWSSSVPSAAPIGALTGIVTGLLTGGSSLITYTLPTGCTDTVTIHVSPSPTAITGPLTVCLNDSIMLTDTVAGGVWTSSAPTIVAIGSLSGIVTGISTSSATITYSLGSGCQRYLPITVNPLPALPSASPLTICQGNLTTVHDGSAGGVWSVAPGSASLASIAGSTTSTSATVDATVITGSTLPTVATILYTALSTGCANWVNININPLPAPIVGSPQVCIGSSTPMTDATPGGAWSLTLPPPTVATIGSSTGSLSGIAAGTTTVSYTALGCSAILPVTVNPLPGIIAGSFNVCQGLTTTLTSSPATGTWSISPASPLATISGTGGSAVITAASTGTGSINVVYTLPTGCSRNTAVAVNITPQPIVGPSSICVGFSTSMSDPTTTPAGTWSSSNTSRAAINPGTGAITTGPSTGAVTISYTIGSCAASTIFNVLPPPLPISGGPLHVCVGSAVTLTDATPGGTWASENPAFATVNPLTGSVTGISAGTVIISYGSYGTGGCFTVAPVVVNPISPITGDSVVCIGLTTGLNDITLGGEWSSASPAIASVSSGGVVTGESAATTLINYTILATGCTASKPVTVNPLPAAISGPNVICVGQTTSLTDLTPGGVWSCSPASTGTVDGFGNVTGIAGGVVTVTYTNGTTGCYITYPVTVNALPDPIAGPNTVCLGSNITLTSSGVGVWTSSAPVTASVTLTGGVVTGNALGTAVISYALTGSGCLTTTPVTVVNGPSAIFGAPVMWCQGQFTTLYDTSGAGTWTSSDPTIAYIGSPGSGVISGVGTGTATITYSASPGCFAIQPVTVNISPSAITSPGGSTNVCVGQTIILSSFPTGGTWNSSVTSVATVPATPTPAIVTGVSPGSSTVTYTLSDGCYQNTTVFVNAGPDPITGFPKVCVGQATTLGDITPGGTWTSSATGVGTVDAFGDVTGIMPGTTTISYTILSSVCPSQVVVTVNPLPDTITGTMVVCQAQTITLHDAVAGGTWGSVSPSTAIVDPASGIVTGIAAGTTDISYTLGAGCYEIANVTVNPVPMPIYGTDSICQGQTTTLADVAPSPSGTWSTTSTAIAPVGATTGVVTGVAAGIATISYNVNGCAATYAVTVNTQPTAITGNTNVCYLGTSPLHDAIPGGFWTSAPVSIATIGSATGVVTGVALGTAVVSYTMPAGACHVTTFVNVLPLPTVYTVTGTANYCAGGTGVPIFLSGSAVGVNYLLYNGLTATGTDAGTGAALNFGLQTVAGTYTVVAYSVATGCQIDMAGSAVVGITPLVTPSVTLHATPGDTVCTGTAVTFVPTPVNGGTGPLYEWSVNGVNVASSNTYAFIPANGDTVAVKLTSNANCPSPPTASVYQVLKVDPYADPSVGISASPSDLVCQGSVVSLSANPTYGGVAPTYTWLKNGVIAASGDVYAFVPHNNDVLYVIMHSDYHCQLNSLDTSSEIVIRTDSQLVPIVTISAFPGTLVSVGQSVTLTASVVNGGVAPTYQWFINGIPQAAATNATFTSSSFAYQQEDSVSVQVTANGTCPVTGHQWVFIQVAPAGVGQVANAGGDINVVPNPNKGEFMVKGSLGTTTDEEVSLEITDILGQVVYKNNVTAKNGMLNEHIVLGNTVANGMYMLSLRSDAATRVFHIVIEQ